MNSCYQGLRLCICILIYKLSDMKKIAGLLLIIFLFAGCTSSHIISTWKAENTRPGAYQTIMVVALFNDSTRIYREKMEEHLVGDLKNMGFKAMSSYQVFGPRAFDNMTEDAVIAKLKDKGVDAVITAVLLSKEKESRYIPSHVYRTPFAVNQRRFYGYYNTLNERIYSPEYYVENSRYFWESNLYDMTTKELIYSVQTESFDPASPAKLGHEYGKLIVKNMQDNGMLSAPSTLK